MGVVKSVQLVVNDWVVSKLLKGDINLHSLALVQRCISSILSKNEEYYVGIENEMNAVAVDRPQGHMITNRIDDAQATTHSWTTNNRFPY